MTAISGISPPQTGECYAPPSPGKTPVPDVATPRVEPRAEEQTPVASVPVNLEAASLTSIVASLTRALRSFFEVGKLLDNVGSTAAVGVHATTKQKAGIEIRTQEGDVVRIKYSHRLEANAGAARVLTTDGSVAATQVAVSERSRLLVSVEGNLSAEELKAIDDVLVKVESLAKEFFSGDVEGAFAKASELNIDSAQLADVAVRLSQRQRVAVVAKPLAEPAPAQPEPAPVPQPPIAEEVTQPNSSVAAIAEPPSLSAPVPEAQAAITPPESSQTATQSIVSYVARLTAQLQANDGEVRLGMSFHEKLTLLLDAIRAHLPNEAAVNKLSDVAAKTASA